MQTRKMIWAALALLGSAWIAPGAMAAKTQETVYYTTAHGNSNTYLARWTSASKARVTTQVGTSKGSLVIAGNDRTVTLDDPFTQVYVGFPDSCGNQYTVERSVEQVLFRLTSGTLGQGESVIIDIGRETVMDGCDAGTETPFGSPTDTGTPQVNLSMNQRPSLTDLVAGVRLAGPQEARMLAGVPFPAQQIVTFQAGGLLSFDDTGRTVPAAVNAEGWLVLDFGTHQTGYTRVARDTATMAETWLQADFVDGAPALVQERLFVKPKAPAGFGSKRETTRRWESGLFVDTNTPFFFELYGDFSGARVSVTLDPPSEVRQPITWAFSGANVTTTRVAGGLQRVRTWVPLANKGANRWVMESEVTINADGSQTPFIDPRVNFYIDRGPAVKPPSAAAAAPAARQSAALRRASSLLP